MAEPQKTANVDGHDGYETVNKFVGEGLSFYTFHLKKYAGVNELGQSMWYVKGTDADGNPTLETTTTPSEASYFLCGTALPDAYGGFGTSLEWKGFDFSIDFAYQIGGKVYDSDYAASMGANKSALGRQIHADLLKGYSISSFEYDNEENLLNPWTASIPRLVFEATSTQNAASDRFLTSASFLSLQNITLGYTLPASLTKRFGVSKLRIYGSADNVWLWSKRQGLDPRQSYDGSASTSVYSPIRTISGGITVTF